MAVQVALLFWLVGRHGLVGVAQAFAAAYVIHVIVVLLVGRSLIGFAYSSGVIRLAVISSGCICACWALPLFLTDGMAVVTGGLVALAGSIFSLRGLAVRLGAENRLTKWISIIPGGRIILPKRIHERMT